MWHPNMEVSKLDAFSIEDDFSGEKGSSHWQTKVKYEGGGREEGEREGKKGRVKTSWVSGFWAKSAGRNHWLPKQGIFKF